LPKAQVVLAGQAEVLARERAQVVARAQVQAEEQVREVELAQEQVAAASLTLPPRQPARALAALTFQARLIRAQH
jgi:hypothetical protein